MFGSYTSSEDLAGSRRPTSVERAHSCMPERLFFAWIANRVSIKGKHCFSQRCLVQVSEVDRHAVLSWYSICSTSYCCCQEKSLISATRISFKFFFSYKHYFHFQVMKKLIPCSFVTPLDCFWEGSKLLGPEFPVHMP